jgi:hypothetical protein
MKLVDTITYSAALEKYGYYIEELRRICLETGEPVEGNCFYAHMNINMMIPQLYTKQQNLYSAGACSQNIIEIGFNAGHSCLLFLISNPASKITCFDICEHAYVEPCFNYLDRLFPGRLRLVRGNSLETLTAFAKQDDVKETFDMAHIDGAHDKNVAHADFMNTWPLVKKGGLIIWDDTQDVELNGLCDGYVRDGYVSEENVYETEVYKHRVLRK